MIRRAHPSDASAIRALWNLAILKTLITFNAVAKTQAEVETAIAEQDAFFVAEEAGAVLGYAAFAPFRTGIGYAQTKEHSIMLAPEARGRGLGRALMDALEVEARAQDVHALIAGVSGSNPGGEPFHAALGFVTVGRMSEVGHKFDAWHDLILMQKVL